MTARTTALMLTACGVFSVVWAEADAQRVSPMPAVRFVQFCNSPRGGGQQICDAYITGMADSFALVEKLKAAGNPQANSDICVPRTATGEAMRGMVVSWIAGHRDRLRDQVGEVVYAALRDSYPCDGAHPGG